MKQSNKTTTKAVRMTPELYSKVEGVLKAKGLRFSTWATELIEKEIERCENKF